MPAWKSNTRNGYSMTLTLTLRSQDIAKNSSTVSWQLQVNNPPDRFYNARHDGDLSVGSVLVWDQPDSTFNSGPAGQSKTLTSGTRTYTHTANGTLGITFAANLRTHVQNQLWSVYPIALEGLYSLPRIPKIPGKPGIPTVTENESTRQIVVTVPVPESESAITGYQVRRLDNIDYKWVIYSANLQTRSFAFTPVRPLTSFNFQGRAITAAGPGPWSDTRSMVATGSGPWIRVAGVWRKSNAYVRRNGVWIPAVCTVRWGGRYQNVGR